MKHRSAIRSSISAKTGRLRLDVYKRQLQNGLIQPDGIIADCKSGVTGAGRGLAQNLHYAECSGSFTAYKVAAHRHTPEIEQTLSKISGQKITMTFEMCIRDRSCGGKYVVAVDGQGTILTESKFANTMRSRKDLMA